MSPSILSAAQLLDEFRPGRIVYIPGATGELRFLQQALVSEPQRLELVDLISCLIPGVNGFDYTALHPQARLTTFLLPVALRPAFERGQVRVLPLAYSQIANHLTDLQPDVAILHLAPPRGGVCSFGVCADFGPIVAKRARRRIGVINRAMPQPTQAAGIPLDALDALVEIDEPLSTSDSVEGVEAADLRAIGAKVAELVPDGAAVQTGIGGAPAAVWRALKGRRGLRLQSGMVTDGFLDALDAGAMQEHGHVAGFAFGGERLLSRLHGSPMIAFADVRSTHGAAALLKVERLFAINSALEVDLFGQANLEWQGERLISGVGGAPDFSAAAQRSPGGRSILALPATARGGSVSRITARLAQPASLGRSSVDTVVTEFGAVRLSGLSIDERAEALIAIAAPDYRDALATSWRTLRARL